MSKKSKAEEALQDQIKAVRKAKKKLDKALEEMPAVVLEAFEQGIGRNEIEQITGYSNPRIGQWLAEARKEKYGDARARR